MVKRYAVSDLHGQYDLYSQIKEYVNEGDIIFLLGDAGDRGPQPWRTLQTILDDSQCIYLMGNHDLMLVDSIKQVLEYIKDYDDWDWIEDGVPYLLNGAIEPLVYNGGYQTLCGWAQEPKRMEYYQKLISLPIEIKLPIPHGQGVIHLCHAGYTPGHRSSLSVDDLVWDRSHFLDKWDNELGSIMIHGHTPIDFLTDYPYLGIDEYEIIDGYCSYCGGSKICIDRGAHYSGETVLLDLDTFEGKVFRVREDINGAQNNERLYRAV